MRWVFTRYLSESERQQRNVMIDRIDRWWRAFADQADAIDRKFTRGDAMDLPGFMADHLHAIDPQLMWEYGKAVNKPGHRLVITPESERHLRPLVATILERAPRLERWEFYAHRLAEPITWASASVQGRGGYALDEVMVRVRADQHNTISLEYLSDQFTGPDDSKAMSTAFVATESLLGEDVLDRWIGPIIATPIKRKTLFRKGTDVNGAIAIERLQPTVEALINSMLEQLPQCPLSGLDLFSDEPSPPDEPQRMGAVFKLDPPEAEDYAERHDLFVASTMMQPLWQACYSSPIFDSARYSRHGETFCYIKMDGREGFSNESWEDRSALEDELNAELSKAGVGCVWGGGTGRIYSYIDLALTDIDRGVEVVRGVLQRGRIHKRTWVLFFDSALAHEWVGAYDDTPPPPMHSQND